MNFNFEDLDAPIRFLMTSEIKSDICKDGLYISELLNDIGRLLYPQLLLDAVKNGNEATLAAALRANNCIDDITLNQIYNGVICTKTPENSYETLAESEFNRYYLRALSILAIESHQSLEVYRAKEINIPVEEADTIIGRNLDPMQVLNCLRATRIVEAAFGLPPGANAGLTAKLA